jgi:hypothetical protein
MAGGLKKRRRRLRIDPPDLKPNGSRRRHDWSRPLPSPLTIPSVMKLRKLGDVRELLRHLPAAARGKATWLYVADRLDEAARGADVVDVAVALRLVLSLERVDVSGS